MNTENRIRSLIVLMVTAVLLGAGVLLLVVRAAGFFSADSFVGRIATSLTGRSTSFNTNAPVVVEKMQALQRLETISYSLDTVVEGASANSTLSAVLPDVLYGDRILMVVHGQVIAGIDFSKLQPQDVVVKGRSVKVTLPPAEIFVSTLDNAHTRVYSRTTGWLTPPDKDLESATRAKAEQQLKQAALEDGILDVAHKNACASITLLLSSLGFQQVTVN